VFHRFGRPPRALFTVSAVLAVFAMMHLADAQAAPASMAATAARAPSFSLPGRGSETVVLDSLQAKVVLVDFWASWCVPCRSSFSWLNTMREKYGSKGLAIVAVNLDKDRAAADAFLVEHPASFLVAFDPKGKTADAYHVSAMPSSYLVSADGVLILRHQGFDPKKTSELETTIAQACAP
jgi:thiol-disulfide isomerase/thioredoxin